MPPETPETPDAMRAEFRAIRKQLRLTQKAYGAALRCEPNTVARYERGVLRVPRRILHRARALLDLPKEVVTITRARRPRVSRLTAAAFVLVRVLPDDAPCWHGPASVEAMLADDAQPCQGHRLHFVALVPPTKRVPRRRTETMTCEAHAYTALYWLQKQYQGWLVNSIRGSGQRWFQHWRATLRRLDEEATAQGRSPGPARQRGHRARQQTQEEPTDDKA